MFTEGWFLESAAQEKVEKIEESRLNPPRRFLNWKMGVGSVIVVGALALGGLCYYQKTHFNSHITINGVNVGGLTADQALKELESSIIKNEVYLGKTLVFDGNDAKMAFTNRDLPEVKKVLTKQQTFFPSSKKENYALLPSAGDQYRSQTMKQLLEEKLTEMNKNLKAPKDAEVHLEDGKIIVTKSIDGKQYDVKEILQQYQKQEYKSEIHLNPVYIQPIKENNPQIQKEKQILQALLQRTVNYKVQDQVYPLKGSDVIKHASVSKDGKVSIDPKDMQNEIAKINASQSTLNKSFQFKTHSGTVITVQGQSYGWALNVAKEAKQIQEAFENGQSTVVASHIYGNGWDHMATGFNTTTNNGIGDTYAEVSIAEQRIWLYKNGKMVLTTNVVTGRHDVGEDTHPGVWFILYKKSPSILEGSEYGQPHYRVKVNYWAPFTDDGQGFHDAGWRTNWSSTAYLHNGSGGCVNTPANIMEEVYNNLSQYEPVVIY